MSAPAAAQVDADPASPPHLLEVRGLVAHYGKVPALHGVDLVVPAGTVTALLGPNGAGKSTVLKAIAGLVPPTSGEVLLHGDSLDGAGPHDRARRGICLIPEGRGVFPNLTVAENLKLALDGRPGARDDVLELFPRLGERLEQRAGTLSGGEQQMLALARAVGAEPALLMADELSLGLAPRLVQTVFDTLRSVHEQQGRTLLLVEQYAAQAVGLADLVYILNRGAVVWAGDPDELAASTGLAEAYLGGTP